MRTDPLTARTSAAQLNAVATAPPSGSYSALELLGRSKRTLSDFTSFLEHARKTQHNGNKSSRCRAFCVLVVGYYYGRRRKSARKKRNRVQEKVETQFAARLRLARLLRLHHHRDWPLLHPGANDRGGRGDASTFENKCVPLIISRVDLPSP